MRTAPWTCECSAGCRRPAREYLFPARCDRGFRCLRFRCARFLAVRLGAGIRAGVHDARIDARDCREERPARVRGHVGGVGQNINVAQREAAAAASMPGAVEQREAFLASSATGENFSRAASLRRRKEWPLKSAWPSPITLARGAPAARDRRSSNGACEGNHGMNAGIEHGAKGFNGCGLDSAKTFGECVRAQQYNRARFGFAKWFADSASV